ncbi:MAG: dihydrofolate reductase [Candidatus Omnitrophota bacterium]
MRTFDIIVAVDKKFGIGRDGTIPWQLSDDLKHFKAITTATRSLDKKNAVIMGRKTWESLPDKFRPLPGRINLVLTKSKGFSLPEGVLQAGSFEAALSLLSTEPWKTSVEKVFVIGGGQIFAEALKSNQTSTIYLTQILEDFHCDTFFPHFDKNFKKIFISPHFLSKSLKYFFTIFSRI